MGTLGDAGTWTFNRVDPFPWDLDGGSFDAGRYTKGMLASSIALGAAHFDAGPSAPSGVGAWAVTDSGIAELVLWNGPNNATWNQVPSSLPLVHVGTHLASPLNAVQISASWEAGSPWVVTEEGYVYSAPGWPRQ